MVSEILFLSLFFVDFGGVCLVWLAFFVCFVFACLVFGFVLDFVVGLVGFCCCYFFIWFVGVLCFFFFKAVLAVSETNFLPFLIFFVVVNLNIHQCFGSLFLLQILLKVNSRFVRKAPCIRVLAGLELILFIGAGRMGVRSSWMRLSCLLMLTPNIQLLCNVGN